MSKVHSFNLKVVVNEIDGKITLVVPQSLEKHMGIDNMFGVIKELGNATFTTRNWEKKLTRSILINPKVFRTCCGCEEQTFHDHNDECVICGRTNVK